MTKQHVGASQEIWDAINKDLQQIVDDASCGEGRWAESLSSRLEAAVAKLNAAVGHEREGYEAAIASGFEVDRLRNEVAQLKAHQVPNGYALIGITALKAWGKYEDVAAACQYPVTQTKGNP